MASSGQASGSAAANPDPPTLTRAPTDQRSCWICMDSAAENPNATWANPCNCSLEAHEACLLRWIAETEQSSGRPKNGVLCPQCKALIRIEQPHDSFVVFRDRLHRAYSRMSPIMLLLFLSSGAMAGSAWYGLMATNIFAGSFPTAKWLTSNGALLKRPSVPLLRWKPFWMFNLKLWVMSLIGPTITIIRAFPPLGNLVCLPASILYGGTLVLMDNMPSWPPSPEWAMTLMPVAHLTYQSLYYEFFGSLEKRLNRALRGRPEAEEPPPPQQQPAVAQGQGVGANGVNGAPQPEAEEDPGAFANMLALGRAVWGLFGDDANNDIGIEANVRVEAIAHDHDRDEEEGQGDDDAGLALELVVEVADEVQDEEQEEAIAVDEAEQDNAVEEIEREPEGRVAAELAEDAAPAPIVLRRQQQNGQAEGAQELVAEQRAAPARAQDERAQDRADRAERAERREQRRRQRQERRRNRNGNRNANRNGNQNEPEERGTSVLTEICNGVVTSLMYPVVSYGMGELIRAVAPKAWVASPGRRPATGLLQQRWGRSLVGGCLFVVLKDAAALYTKYRRVQVKKNRRVRNVERAATQGP